MTELKSLRAEELEFSYRQELIEHPEAATTRYLDLRAELLRRLQPEGLADFKIHKFPDNLGEHGPAEAESSSAGPEPRPHCPKCDGSDYEFKFGSDLVGYLGKLACKNCGPQWGSYYDIQDWTDFAQFFPASQQVPQLAENSMRCIECKAKICDCVFKRLCDFRAASQQVDAREPATRFAEFDDASHPFNIWWHKHGQYMMSGGGRKEFIWACRGWIAREQKLFGVEVTGESLNEGPAATAQPKRCNCPYAEDQSQEWHDKGPGCETPKEERK